MNWLKNIVGCSLSLFSLAAAAAGLPYGYQQIPYIYADNSKNNTYVLTDYTPNPSTDKIVAEVSFPVAPTANLCVWCARSGTSSPVNTFTTFVLKHASDGNKLKFTSHYGKQSNDEAFLSAVSTDTQYTVITEDNVSSIVAYGTELASCTHPADSTFTAAGGPMMLFASYNGNTSSRGNYGSFRLLSLKVYRNGEIFYDIVPVRDSANTLMLFNKTDNPIQINLVGTFTGDPWKSFLERLATSENVISAADAPAATGGDIIWKIDNDYMHIFTNANETATFTPTVKNLSGRVLMVAGGGSGGGSRGGGGGAGGMIDANGVALAANTSYTVVVGKGGDPVEGNVPGNNGSASSVSALDVEAVGGGGGGTYNSAGSLGGSGGGGAGITGNPSWTSPTVGGECTEEQGSHGGQGGVDAGNYPSGGGGGGAGAVGGDGNGQTAAGAGGDGRVSTILGYEEIFAGGGGGGTYGSASALGGAGGGGTGGDFRQGRTENDITAKPGEDGLGGGGGGGPTGERVNIGSARRYGAAGGNGIVIIRYRYTAGGKDVIFVPPARTGLVYDGTEQQGVDEGEGYTLSGHKATGGGTHTAIATLTDPDNAEWADDGSTDPKSIEWSIAQAQNEWTTEAAISKELWIVEGDTPGVLTVPVAKFGEVVATLNGAEWDGATLPTAVGDYTAVWSVAETADFQGLSVTKTFQILPVPSPEDYALRYSADGVTWIGVDSYSDALESVPDGGIIEINQNLSFSTAASTITKSLTLRSCTARNERYEMKATGNARLIDVNADGGTVVVSNLVVNGNAKDAQFVYLTKGTLTLGHNLLLKKGSYNNGCLMGADAGTVVNLNGIEVSNSSGNWGLLTFYNACTVNLYDCDIHGVGNTVSNERGSILHMSNTDSVLNVYGGTITGNVSQVGYGQINCKGTVNFFGGKPVLEDFCVPNAEVIKLNGNMDAGASVGVMYGAAEGDAFGTYVSGDRMGARAFYPTWTDNPKLRGSARGTQLVWKTPTGAVIVYW